MSDAAKSNVKREPAMPPRSIEFSPSVRTHALYGTIIVTDANGKKWTTRRMPIFWFELEEVLDAE
jgi:hypothetical protein